MNKKRYWLLGIPFVVGFIAGIATYRWFATGDIHDAARKGNMRKVKSLLGQNPELVNAEDNPHQCWTPLHYAADAGHKDVVEFLISQGAHVDATDKMGWAPLLFAVEKGHKAVVEVLLAKEADVYAKREYTATTPLHRCVFRHQKKIAELLIANGIDVNVKDGKGKAALYYAVQYDKEIADLLRKNGAVE